MRTLVHLSDIHFGRVDAAHAHRRPGILDHARVCGWSTLRAEDGYDNGSTST